MIAQSTLKRLTLLTLTLSLAMTARASAGELSTAEISTLLRSPGGRYILKELSVSSQVVDAVKLDEPSAEADEVRKLSRGIDEVRTEYLKSHPDQQNIFSDQNGTLVITEGQARALQNSVHREGLSNFEFVRAMEEVRGFRFAAEAFLDVAKAPDTSGIPAGMTPVTDQWDTLQCWGVTATARADLDAGFKLSARYTLYTKTKAEVMADILNGEFKIHKAALREGGPEIRVYYEQGGELADAAEAMKLYGVMPEEAYPGFPKKDEKVFIELNDIFRDFDHRFHAKKIRLDDPEVIAEVDHRVTVTLNKFWGKPPAQFEFSKTPGGPKVTYSDPLKFRDEFLPSRKNPEAIELNFAPKNDEALTSGEDSDPTLNKALHEFAVEGVPADQSPYRAYLTGNHEKLMRVLEETLRAGYKPALQYKVIDESKTQKDGEIGFAVHGLKVPTEKHVLEVWDHPNVLDHYVVAIEPVWDEKREHLVTVWIKNTWDTSAKARFGFHRIWPDYFPLFEAVEINPAMEDQFVREGLISRAELPVKNQPTKPASGPKGD